MVAVSGRERAWGGRGLSLSAGNERETSGTVSYYGLSVWCPTRSVFMRCRLFTSVLAVLSVYLCSVHSTGQLPVCVCVCGLYLSSS